MNHVLRASSRKVIPFALVGTLGFLVDSAATLILINSGVTPFIARIPALGLAITTTWLLNRNLTFPRVRNTALGTEYLLYVLIQTLGATINYGIFLLALETASVLRNYPAAAIAIGSIVAMTFNFVALTLFLFRNSRTGKGRTGA